MTEYVVLVLDPTDSNWTQLEQTVQARSAKAAIREHIDKNSDGYQYVAVPARSWQPVTVTVETRTQLKFQ